jgi:hypothetical protein
MLCLKDNMSNHDEKKKDNSDASIQPDPETLHTTDPQENMKGPVSSFMKKVEDNVEEKGGTKTVADDEAEK